jgi:ClpP class serine protease
MCAWLPALAKYAYHFAHFDGTAPQFASEDVNWLGDKKPAPSTVNGVDILPISGPLALRPSYIEENLGVLGYDTISGWLQASVAKGAKGIVLAFDSPGGSVCGMLECAGQIAEVAKKIPVAAFTDSTMASAAFALAAGAGGIYCTQSATVGSVGVMCEILDASAFLESAGLKFHSFASGKFKGAGSPTQAMSEDHAAYFTGLVNKTAADFKGFVSSHRPGISGDSMEGQAMDGSEAVQAGFADAIVPGLGAAIDALSTGAVGLKADYGIPTIPGRQEFRKNPGDMTQSRTQDARELITAGGRVVAAISRGGGGSRAFTAADFKIKTK